MADKTSCQSLLVSLISVVTSVEPFSNSPSATIPLSFVIVVTVSFPPHAARERQSTNAKSKTNKIGVFLFIICLLFFY